MKTPKRSRRTSVKESKRGDQFDIKKKNEIQGGLKKGKYFLKKKLLLTFNTWQVLIGA